RRTGPRFGGVFAGGLSPLLAECHRTLISRPKYSLIQIQKTISGTMMHRATARIFDLPTWHACCLVATVVFGGLERKVTAAPFTPGNILVSSTGKLSEYTPTGQLLQSILVPQPDGGGTGLVRQPGGVTMDAAGNVYIANFA